MATRQATPTPSENGRARPGSLADRLDNRRNALNAIRLLLAVLVIVWHSFPLTGHDIDFAPLRQLFSHLSVDGFFTISGFLIVASWERTPRWRSFLRARVLRIFPAFWVSLLLTALIIAPLSLVLGATPVTARFWASAGRYVVSNALLWVNQYGIAGTPAGVPYPGTWNGSMWTLAWEFLCYLGVLALGVAGLLRNRFVLPALLAASVLGVLVSSYGPVHSFWVTTGAHFGVMFLAGAVVHRYRARIPLTGTLLGLAALVVVASAWLPDYRVVAALPLAYLMIGLGALGRHRRLQVHNDLSYGTYIYAFPVQQLLAVLGLAAAGPGLFALVAAAVTLPLAAASWFAVERPSLRLKKVRRPVTVQELAVAEHGG